MNNQTLIILGIVVAIVVSVSSGVFYVVREDEQVVITQFGKPIGQTETTAGLKVKGPFIQKIDRFDKRILEWDGLANEIPTKDKNPIVVDFATSVFPESKISCLLYTSDAADE